MIQKYCLSKIFEQQQPLGLEEIQQQPEKAYITWEQLFMALAILSKKKQGDHERDSKATVS